MSEANFSLEAGLLNPDWVDAVTGGYEPWQKTLIGTSAGAVGTEYNCDLLAEEVAKVGSILALTSSTDSDSHWL